MNPILLYSMPFMAAAVLINTVAFFAFARRGVKGSGYLAWLCVAAGFWAASEGTLYFGLGAEINMRITLIQYFGIAQVPPLALLFSLSVLGGEEWLNKKWRIFLFSGALITILSVLTNGWHQLVFKHFYPIHDGPLIMLGVTHGRLWWVIIAYNYSLLALLTIFLVQRALRYHGYYRQQAAIILASVTMVWFANAIYVSGNSPVPNMDISPIAFSLVALSMAWGFFRYNLLDLLPIAKAEVFRGLDDAIVVVDLKGRIVDINPAAIALFQSQLGQAIGLSMRQFFQKYPQVLNIIKNKAQADTIACMGSPERVMDVRVSDLTDRRGVARGKLIVLRDVTHYKQTERKLQISEKRFRNILEQVAEISIQGYDEQRRVTFWNLASEKLYGYSAKQALGQKLEDLIIPPPMRSAVIDGHRQWLEHGQKIPAAELVLMNKDGADVPVFSSHVMHETSQGQEMFCIDIDMGPIKQAQRALQESEAHFRAIFHSTTDFIFLKDRRHRYLKVNPALEKLFQLPASQLIGKTDADFFGKESAQDIQRIDERVLAGESIEQEDSKTVNGRMYCFHVIKTPVYDSTGNIAGLCGIARDITQRKRVQAERERLLLAIEQSNEIIVITNPEGMIQYVNPAFERITGYSRQEAIGQNPRILKSGEHNEAFYHKMWQMLISGKPWQGQFINRKKAGGYYTEQANISPVFNEAGEIINFVAVKRDITENIELSERLRQSQKMEAIGTLAGGIAHDFNNILFPLMGYAEMLQADIPSNSPLQNYISGILNASVRAKELIKQILTFSRQADQERKPLKLQLIVKESLSLIRKSIPTTVDIQQEIDSDCGMVIADPIQMHQILINLATNAYQSMGNSGGLLTVTLAQEQFDADQNVPAMLSAGRYAHLTVSDTGSGIDNDVLAQIFDPYFTTKPPGKGTGLGLSVVQGIVKKCGGEIGVESEIGKGTAVHVFLPVTEFTAEKTVGRMPEPALSGGMENILLVDDESGILDMERQMLERLGYHVTTRVSSVDALEAFKANPDHFDLVMTDMSMPNMTGVQLAKHLKKIKPLTPVVLCTGFGEQFTRNRRQQMGIDGFIMKPASVRDVAATLRQVFDHKN